MEGKVYFRIYGELHTGAIKNQFKGGIHFNFPRGE